MKRLPHLLIAFGLALIVLGTTLSLFSPVDAAPTALVPTTPNDFLLPGTQPHQMVDALDAYSCIGCHLYYGDQLDPPQPHETETWFAWQGSMMAQAARDPLFWAALDVANADAANAGEFCLRCHIPRGWLDGRSSQPDGSAMLADSGDMEGVQCITCHRSVDPVYSPENPARDIDVLATLTMPVTVTAPMPLLGSAAMIIDPLDYRRGPFVITEVVGFDPHSAQPTQLSPYHQDAAFCGTCHDISNPVFSWNESTQAYELNPLDMPGDLSVGFPVERTYSEWYLSDYNTPEGIYAPQFGGNTVNVSTCQDCHMYTITGIGAQLFGDPAMQIRDDMSVHDMTGGNTWVPQIIPLHPVFSATFNNEPVRAEALISGTLRARYMLQHAATVSATLHSDTLTVTVVNETGHKLPTGYPEGRRMWLQVQGYDAAGNLVYESGAYDASTAVLTQDPDLTIYQVEQGLTPALADLLPGLEAGPTFHFALNNVTVNDSRIPPRGYVFADYAALGAAPVTDSQPDPTMYADGQYWDTAVYTLPSGVVTGRVRLLYQTASKEYIEFLRDNNPNAGYNNGQILYDLWQQTNMSAPEVMAEIQFGTMVYLPLILGE
ncbi:MAG: hypothetical protein H6662_03750 [Ardenticatenaceae bacterium]|nr:hypothetical protein [Anaerolineales bacterium]MCB8920677.1 hypothetical protein [Ardenticatenaceae bacterium]MCB8989637.1 hypothetical protein [Ardenticatenaceae bacterium]MCB9002905.1 hypothetical protein [Ardenticatenaceae bacterium]